MTTRPSPPSPSVLFINRVFPPSTGATGELLKELAAELVRAGWHVTVLTSRTEPSAAAAECVDGVRVERVRSLPFTRASHGQRALSYLSLYPALLRRALVLPRHDLVMTMTDPPLQAILGVLIAFAKGCRHGHWAQDLYPELAEEIGVLPKAGWAARWLRRCSNWALRHSHLIVAVGRCMKQRLLERGLAPAQIVVVPNWSDLPPSTPPKTRADDPAEPPFRRRHSLTDRFVVMYSGNLGLAHDFAPILDAAELLQAASTDIQFVIIGDGPQLPWVQQEVARRRLPNVQFLPFQPKEKLMECLSAADLHLVCMKPELCGLVVPSKVYGVAASRRPCLFLGPAESEAARFLCETEGGSVLSQPDGPALANLIRSSAANSRPAGERPAPGGNSAPAGLSGAAQTFDRLLRDTVLEPAGKDSRWI